jgi:hypothetical protein
MAARLKSSVLRREERGIGSIALGRLIASTMIGGIGFMLLRLLGVGILVLPGALASFVLALMLTNHRYGIPLYRYLLITMRARLLMQALAQPTHWQAQAITWFNFDTTALTLDTVKLLSAPVPTEEGSLDEWEIVPESRFTEGFEIVTDTLFTDGMGL